jgi:hypothetical protein
VPASLIDQKHRVSTSRDGLGDLDEVQIHRLGIASGQNEGSALSLLRTDCTEDIGGGGTLVTGCVRTGAAFGPPTGDFVLLADACLILEPNLYCRNVDGFFARDFFQTCGKAFLKSSITPSGWAWWRGRAESLR